MRHFPDLHHLSFVLKQKDAYQGWATEESKHLEQLQTLESGSAALYHKLDAFDSKLFGFPVGKVEYVFGDSPQEITKVVDEFMHTHSYQYVLVRVSQDHVSWIQAFERHGAIFLDTTVELMIVPTTKKSQDSLIPLRLSSHSDLEQLKEIAYTYSHGRFFTDPDIKSGTQMYLEWIENSVKGITADRLYVYEAVNKIQGYVSIKYSNLGNIKVWKIPLVGKHPQSSMNNLATSMLDSLIVEAIKDNVDLLLIATQGTNIAALRAYNSAGFSIYSTGISLGWKKSRLA